MKRGMVLTAITLTAWLAFADTEVNETKKASPDGEVEVSNIAGSVDVLAWDRDEIQVEGTLGRDVERLEFVVRGDEAKIKVILPRGKNRKAESHLTIHVPAGNSLDIETVSASITVSGVQGARLDLESVSGSIDAQACPGEMDASSTSGSVALSGALGPVAVETVSGRIEVSGAPVSVRAESVSGSIDVEGVGESVDAETISGRIELVCGAVRRCSMESVSGSLDFEGALRDGGRLEANSISGSIGLRFTEEVSGEFEIGTFSGSIQCDFGPSAQRLHKFAPGRELSFRQGDGNARVSVETFSGSVRIR